jgi:hypothetical protein
VWRNEEGRVSREIEYQILSSTVAQTKYNMVSELVGVPAAVA